ELIRVVVSHHRARWPGGPDRVLHRARPGPGGRRVAGAGMRTMVVGHGGRESALAMRMADHGELHAFVGHANPTTVRHAQSSGGSASDSVLIEEKVSGAEFTIQAVSDGRTVVFPPSTYDYPYRFDGDEGPGTGGMGSLTVAGPILPFMTPHHYEEACAIIAAV